MPNIRTAFPLIIFISLRGHFRRLFKMGESSTNILNLSESALNSLKKSDLIQKILDLKGKVVINADLHKLCERLRKHEPNCDRE